MVFSTLYQELQNSDDPCLIGRSRAGGSLPQAEYGVMVEFSKWCVTYTMKSAKIFESIWISFFTVKMKIGMRLTPRIG